MKRLILLASHYGTESEKLCNLLNQTKRIQWLNGRLIYEHPSMVGKLTSAKLHKYNNYVGLYLDEVIYNTQTPHLGIFKVCDFIFLVREPRYSIKETGEPTYGVNQYILRLRRLYEMIKLAPNSIFLTWEDLSKNALDLIKDKYELSEDLKFETGQTKKTTLPADLLREAERAYELFIYRINKREAVLRC